MWSKYLLNATVHTLVNYFIFCFTKVRKKIKSFINVVSAFSEQENQKCLFVCGF